MNTVDDHTTSIATSDEEFSIVREAEGKQAFTSRP